MAVSPARAAAFDILLRVQEREAYASELLHSGRLDDLNPQDRGLCTELVMGTLRWQSALDAAIAQHSSQKLNRLDREVLIALRLAAYQLRHLDRVPSSAAVNESVELVKRAHKKSAVPFANAVFRKLASTGEEGTATGVDRESRAPRSSTVAGFSLDTGVRLRRRRTPLRVRPTNPEYQVFGFVVLSRRESQDTEAETELRACGVAVAPGRNSAHARTVTGGDVAATNAFLEGRVAIQDEASQLVALLVGKGTRILDCCAAPGGKTAVLAEFNIQVRTWMLNVER